MTNLFKKNNKYVQLILVNEHYNNKENVSMTKYINRAVVLAQRPSGKPKNEDFRIEEQTLPELA
jgi:hypothetical protein